MCKVHINISIPLYLSAWWHNILISLWLHHRATCSGRGESHSSCIPKVSAISPYDTSRVRQNFSDLPSTGFSTLPNHQTVCGGSGRILTRSPVVSVSQVCSWSPIYLYVRNTLVDKMSFQFLYHCGRFSIWQLVYFPKVWEIVHSDDIVFTVQHKHGQRWSVPTFAHGLLGTSCDIVSLCCLLSIDQQISHMAISCLIWSFTPSQ